MAMPALRFALLVPLLAVPLPAAGQDVRMQSVEHGLVTANVPRGVTPPRHAIEDRMRHYRVPGVSVAVIDSGRIVWAKAWGVKRAGGTEPVDTSTIFQAASISKPVSALAALSLVREGRLTLHQDINTFLRTWTVPDNEFTASAKITLRHLLSHTAGLTVHGFRGYAPDEPVPTVAELLDGSTPANSAPVRVDVVPGTLWRYSGGGTTVAQLAMMDATGQSFADLMQERVLGPLEMSRSTFAQPLPPERHADAAVGHRATGAPVAGDWHTYPEQAAAGLWTTPSDLARLAIEVQRAWHGRSDRVIDRTLAQVMLTEVQGRYGLGFGLPESEEPAFSHGGANEGFRAQFLAFRDRGQGAIVMTNGDQGAALAAEINRAIAAEYGWPGFSPRERDVIEADPALLDSLAGAWILPDGPTIGIQPENGALRITLDGAPYSTVVPERGGRWFSWEGGAEIEFVETDGRQEMIIHGIAPAPVRATRSPAR
jgi:CubicO group peptidase (beta-lactamase class C family)